MAVDEKVNPQHTRQYDMLNRFADYRYYERVPTQFSVRIRRIYRNSTDQRSCVRFVHSNHERIWPIRAA